jgi:hypothetical protein
MNIQMKLIKNDIQGKIQVIQEPKINSNQIT